MNDLGMLMIIILVIAIFASIAAWVNTYTLLKEVAEIKEYLGIKKEGQNSGPFIKNDLDH